MTLGVGCLVCLLVGAFEKDDEAGEESVSAVGAYSAQWKWKWRGSEQLTNRMV